MRSILVLAAAVMLALAVPAEARTRDPGPHAHKTRVHASRPFKPFKPYAPKGTSTVRVRRADGTVMTGYRDSEGTHLRGPDGRTIHCRRQSAGVADVDIACR